MVLLHIKPFQPDELIVNTTTGLPPSFEHVNRISGAIMVGYKAAWASWIHAYYHTLTRMVNNGQFVGVDQNVMAAVAVTHPDRVTLITPTNAPSHGDPWFFLQAWFSDVCAAN